jgi:PAS domain S-box-containing protein
MSTGFSNPLLPTEGSNGLGDREHLVQFYEEGAFIADSVGGLLARALQQGRGAVVIATKRQRDAIERTLKQKGVAVEAAAAQGQYVSLDAAETLSRFMVNGQPDAALFTSVIGGVLAGVSNGFPGVRVFGEMVTLLWAEGKQDATIELEKLWNELAKTHFFSLCCCYPASAFRHKADGEGILAVCAEHSKVLPSEWYLTLESSDERLRAIAQLQQQANALATEVAEREGIERQIGRREKELADFLENAVEGLHKVGPDGVILWANQAELNLLGYSADEYIGHPIAKFHADAGVIASILDRLSRGETLYDFPARLRCKDGSVKHVLIHSNVLWEDGKFVHTRCFTRDVTEKVKLEKELRNKLEELADADRRKDEFLALLAHELRNPLAPLSDAATLLARQGDDPEIRRRLQEVMQRQISQMARLIEDLTDVSRINQGKINLQKEPVELQSLLRSATETVLLPPGESSHDLKIQLPEEPLPIHADAVRMTQVVLNLLNNARKYTPPGDTLS